MRIHTVASLTLAGMGLTSAAVWWLAPASAAVDERRFTADAPPPAAAEDRSQFTAGATLTLEGRLGHARIAAGREQSSFLLATVTGANDARATAVPLDLAIVIDTSGSMRGSRLENAIEAARGMVRRMRDDDRVTVVTYSRDAQLLVPPTRIDAFTRESVAAAISNVQSMGDTCISCGLETALAQVRPESGRVSRILLLSDGQATSGVRDENGFRLLAQRARAMGTTVTTIGVDVEYNELIMSTIARSSNGRHYFVETPAALPPVFDQELESLARTVANEVELVVELADGVEIEHVFDRDVRREGNRLVVPFGTVAPGEEKRFLIGVRLPSTSTADRPVAELQLRYADLVRNERGECSGVLAARTTLLASQVSELDPLVEERVSRSQTADALREANELARLGQLDAARDRLDRRAHEVDAQSRHSRPRMRRGFSEQSSALRGGRMGFDRPGNVPMQTRRNAVTADAF